MTCKTQDACIYQNESALTYEKQREPKASKITSFQPIKLKVKPL